MNSCRWDNPRAFGDQVNRSNPETTSSGKVKPTGEGFSWSGIDDHRAKIEAPSCWQYKPGDFRAVRRLNWDDINDENDDDESWADSGGPSEGKRHPGDGNDNDDSEGEEDMQGGEKSRGKGKGTKDGMGTRKGKATGDGNGKGNSKGKGIVKQTPGGDDISRAIALQLQKEMYEADSDQEGWPERVYLEPEASPTVSISSDGDSDSTQESDSEVDSELDPHVNISMEDEVDAEDGVDSDRDVDMERDGDDAV